MKATDAKTLEKIKTKLCRLISNPIIKIKSSLEFMEIIKSIEDDLFASSISPKRIIHYT